MSVREGGKIKMASCLGELQCFSSSSRYPPPCGAILAQLFSTPVGNSADGI